MITITVGTSITNYARYENLFSEVMTSPYVYLGTLGAREGARGGTVG